LADVAPRSYYLDLKNMVALAREHTTSTTVATNALLILDRVLGAILAEGRKPYSERCGTIACAIRQHLVGLGYRIYGRMGYSNGVTALVLPATAGAIDGKAELERRYGLLVGGGLGQLQGQVIRVAHYGNVSVDDIVGATVAFRSLLEQRL